MANNPLVNMFRVKELRERIFFTLGILFIFRLGSVLPVPGVDPHALKEYFNNLASKGGNAFAAYMDFFAGGAFSNFSVFMLGVMPYISTQIIMQLLLIIFPSLKRKAEEEGGQKKIQSWTRIASVFVCAIQSFAITQYARSIDVIADGMSVLGFSLIAILTVTTGSMFLVWLGEQITQRGIGNGVSMIIFAGIVARLPQAVWELIKLVMNNEINFVFVLVVFVLFVVVVALVIYEQQGQRKIPVNYAKRVVGRKMYGGQNTYIPFKLNPSGVIPVIFASSFLTFPLQIANTLGGNSPWLAKLSAFLNPMGWGYNVLYVLLIVFFAYFYTQVTMNPTEIAKNIAQFFGGTSLLILVGVDLDTMSQVEALLTTHYHDGIVKKGRLRSRNL